MSAITYGASLFRGEKNRLEFIVGKHLLIGVHCFSSVICSLACAVKAPKR
ncbi:MAG: hypothetical protein GDYSWBUE_001224, partial [Candidatus Fervidibacterota bacterium]